MTVTQTRRDRVEAALRDVDDPDCDADVVTSGLVAGVDVDGTQVTVRAGVPEVDDAVRERVTRAMVERVSDVPGVERVRVDPVEGPTEEVTAVGEFDRVIAVASAKGGVGKSTVATTLACALADDHGVGLFDADVHGPNVPALLDVEGPVYADEDGRPRAVETGSDGAALEVMSVGLLEQGTPLAWRGSMVHDAVSELFEGTAWGVDDVLVVDLPPGTGDVVLTTLQEVPVDGVVVVTTPFETSVADTARSVDLFRDSGVPVLGAVVNMTAFTCPSCGDTHDLFGAETDDLSTPVLAELAFAPELQETPTPGDAPAAVDALATAVVEAADAAWEVDAPADAVDIRGTPPSERHERVRSAFEATDSGEQFALVSDRDPSPVVEFLADLADVRAAAFDVSVERRTPDAWLLETTKP